MARLAKKEGTPMVQEDIAEKSRAICKGFTQTASHGATWIYRLNCRHKGDKEGWEWIVQR